jgi:hypothetical protein
MKAVKILSMAFILVSALIGCSKEEIKTNSSATGTWIGKWGYDNDQPSHYYKLVLSSNGTLKRFNDDGEVISTGTWKVSGFNFEGEYTMTGNGSKFLIKGLYSDIAGEITGTWGSAPSYANGGTFDLNKE